MPGDDVHDDSEVVVGRDGVASAEQLKVDHHRGALEHGSPAVEQTGVRADIGQDSGEPRRRPHGQLEGETRRTAVE